MSERDLDGATRPASLPAVGALNALASRPIQPGCLSMNDRISYALSASRQVMRSG
jgi:hypothetical protein